MMDNKNMRFTFKVATLPSQEYVFFNCLYINPKDYTMMKEKTGSKGNIYVTVRNNIMQIKENENVASGNLAIGRIYREMCGIGATGNVEVEYAFDTIAPNAKLGTVKFELIHNKKSNLAGIDGVQVLDEKEIEEFVRTHYTNTPVNKYHVFYIDLNGAIIIARAKELEVDALVQKLENIKHVHFGTFIKETEF
jgi:hypothetical protein